MKGTNAPKDLANKVAFEYDWTPNGRGSGTDILKAFANGWQYLKDSGSVPANFDVKFEDVVDVKFLP